MSVSLNIVSLKKERKKGFYQSQYKDKVTKFQLLLHLCLKDIILDKHKHKQIQFGYNFWGQYKFWIDKDLIYINPQSSYLINSYIEHKALALSNYYSIDIKFNGNINYNKIINLIDEKNGLLLETLKHKISINFIHTNLQIKPDTLLVTSKKAMIYLENQKFIIEPMNIYKLMHSSSIKVENIIYDKNSKYKGEIIAISIE